MKMHKLLAIAATCTFVAAGCGGDSSTGSVDAGVDAQVASPDAGFALSPGNYKATAISAGTDGCSVKPDEAVGALTVPVEVAGGVVSIGSTTNTNYTATPAGPSLGSGALTASPVTLTLVTHIKVNAPSTCEYDRSVTSTVTLDAVNNFGLGVVEKQTNRANCTDLTPAVTSCTSTWSWRMVKQ